jgi:hypothetical protein
LFVVILPEQFLKAEMPDLERESVNILLAYALRQRGRYETASQHHKLASGVIRRKDPRCAKASPNPMGGRIPNGFR